MYSINNPNIIIPIIVIGNANIAIIIKNILFPKSVLPGSFAQRPNIIYNNILIGNQIERISISVILIHF